MTDRKYLSDVYKTPLLDLIYKAASVHRENFDSNEVQICQLLSIKTGACPEDCAYCSQSARYQTFIKPEKFMSVDKILEIAKKAKTQGATRFCMGAAWRSLKNDDAFENVLTIINKVSKLGMQVCCSMGMLDLEQANKLKKAGLYAYNHNIDTSPDFYSKIITTRKFSDRLDTIKNVQKAGISVCCGGILGLGETEKDRIDFIYALCQMDPPPDSIPINTLVPIEGTPLAKQKRISIFDILRVISTTRIMIPKSMIRLSAGRLFLSKPEQALCFLAGANSIFLGDKLLTTPNNDVDEDQKMLLELGLNSK